MGQSSKDSLLKQVDSPGSTRAGGQGSQAGAALLTGAM